MRKGAPEHFSLIRGEVRVCFIFGWAIGGVETIFDEDYIPSDCHDSTVRFLLEVVSLELPSG